MKLYGTIFLSNDTCHLASCSRILPCWLVLLCRSALAYSINVTAAFFCFSRHLVHVNQSTVEMPVLGMSLSFHYQPAHKWRQTRNAGCFTEWGRNMGTVSRQCHSAQGHSVAHSEWVWVAYFFLTFYMILSWGKMQQPITKFCWQSVLAALSVFRYLQMLQTRIWNGRWELTSPLNWKQVFGKN